MNIEIIARGVCVCNGEVLLCRSKGGGKVSYLPGGHIEYREQARAALAREVMEELGLSARVGRFLGCCEHSFVQKGETHAEINLVFAMELEGVATNAPLPAREEWVSFFWQPLNSLAGAGLEPAALRDVLVEWQKNPGFATAGEEWI